MQKLAKIVVLTLLLFGGTFFLFNNFITNFNQEIQKTKNKIDGVEFAQNIQLFILKLQKLRGYSQFKENKIAKEEIDKIKSSIEFIKIDIRKDILIIKEYATKYPALFDRDYTHIIKEIDMILENDHSDPSEIYQKITYIIDQLKEKMYYLGFKSNLLLEADSDKYFLIEIMLKHLPNLIEVTGQIRAKTTKAILDNSNNYELRYALQSSCLLCKEYAALIFRTINEINNDIEKARLLSLLDAVNSESKKMQEYVKQTVVSSNIKNLNAIDFFTISTTVIDKTYELYKVDAEFLNQNLNKKLLELEKQRLYGVVIGTIVILFIIVTIISMVRGYMLYTKSENKIKNNLTSIIKLKNDLEKCETINEISSKALYFFADKFGAIQGAIYIFNEENNKLYIASSFATNDMKPIVELGEGLIGEVAVQKAYIHTKIRDEDKKSFKIEDINVMPAYICTFPLLSHDKIFGVLQLGLLRDSDIVHNDDFAYYIDMIIGFLRDAKNFETSRMYIDLIDKNVITTKTNTKGIVTYVSDAFTKISGYSKDEIIGKSHSVVSHPDTPKEFYAEMWNAINSGKIFAGEVKNLNKNKEDYWVYITITPSMDRYGNILGFSAILQDITDKKKIEEYSITDALTSLYNRRFFDKTFDKELKISKREGKNLVLLIVDIDYFKQYNDIYGHQSGDEVLRKVALAIKASFKRVNDYVYRLGGEEFAVSFYANTKEMAMQKADEIRNSVENLRIEHNGSAVSNYISISIGLSFIDANNTLSVNELYRLSDEALYDAKKSGRNRVSSNL